MSLNNKKSFDPVKFLKKYAMILVFIAIVIFFSAMTNGVFLQARNLSNLFRQMAIIGIMATGLSLVIVAGHIDLSTGPLFGFISGISAAGQVWWNWPTPIAIIIPILVGLVVGVVHGILIAYLKLPAFITTLGTQFVFRGGLLGVIKGQTVAPLHKEFVVIGQGYLSKEVSWAIVIVASLMFVLITLNRRRNDHKLQIDTKPFKSDLLRLIIFVGILSIFTYLMNSYEGVPVPTLILIILVLIYTFIAEKTTFGRSVYAIGGNALAAQYAGISAKRVVTVVFMFSGALSAIAGLIMAARLNAGSPQAGLYLETDAIASAVIGGISMIGGTGKVYGALFGALLMASLDNGMSMMNVPTFWQFIVRGTVLVIAVLFDVTSKRKR